MGLAPAWKLLVGVSTVLFGSACDRGRSASAGGPQPSASVVTIVAGLGYCEDRTVCERECEAGASDRCRRLGVTYEFGHGVDVDGAHATQLYEQACAMKNTDACVAAGRMYEFHHGVAKDDVKAVSFYQRACDLGDPTGCANFAIMLESGRGTPRDVTRAKGYFERACAQGSSLACGHAKALAPPPDAAPR